MSLTTDNESKLARHVTFCARAAHGLVLKGSQAELDTVQLLADNLTPRQHGDFRILVNYNMPVRGSGVVGVGTREMDVIVINKLGLYVIEVKDWAGKIEAYDSHWRQSGQFHHPNVLFSVNDKAKSLRSQLFDRRGPLSYLGRVNVTGLVVLARGRQNFFNHSKHNDRVVLPLDPRELVHAVSSREFHHSADAVTLSDQEIQEIHETLYVQHKAQEQMVIGGKYRVVKELSRRRICQILEAVNQHLPSQRVRVKVYQLNDVSSKGREAAQRVRQSATAVTEMGSHPHIVQTLDLFPHPDRPDVVYEITELVRGKRLDEILGRGRPLPYAQQLQIVEHLAMALDHSHQYGVVHRDISPETVYVTAQGVVKLADFDYAKIVDRETIVQHGEPLLVENAIAAPELELNPSLASPASDIYSLGMLWLHMAQSSQDDGVPTTETVTALALPSEARELLQRMIAQSMRSRPQQAAEVLTEVRKLKR